MTSNRRRKSEIRALQRATGSSYLTAARDLTVPAVAAADEDGARLAAVELKPPLREWDRAKYCGWWADLRQRNGAVMAFRISPGNGWWDLDDLARDVAGALQDRPAAERGLWIGMAGGGYVVTLRSHLDDIAAALDRAGALGRLTARAVPDGPCGHRSCQRRAASTSVS